MGENGRRNRVGNEMPQRVNQAAEAMNNPSSFQQKDWTGRQQGYVPQQPRQYYAAQNPYPQGMAPESTPYRGTVPPQKTNHEKTPHGKGLSVFGIIRIIAVLAIVAALIFYGISWMKTKQIDDVVIPYNNIYCQGVYVDGIHLGGMTPEQAYNSVTSQINQRNSAWNVQLVYQDNVLATITAADLGINVDVTGILNEAWLQGHTGSNPQRLSAMEELVNTPWNGYSIQPTGNMYVIDNLLEQIKAYVETPAEDAYLVEFNTDYSYPFIFSPEREGKMLNVEPLRNQLYNMASTMTAGTVEIVPEPIAPVVTQAELQKHYTLRSTATTKIATSSEEDRNNNIRRALSLVNGTIINPGKQFSFNTVVGERSYANGFYDAVEYVYGEHVMGIGGGVCQASTTVYQAAVCAGMKIVKRSAHSDAVGYADYGMDATVYYSANRKIDLVFENNTDSQIFLTACVMPDPQHSKRLITRVCVYGESLENRSYGMTTEVVEELPPPETKYVRDKNQKYVIYTDQEHKTQEAQIGYVVNSYRVEYTDGVETDRVLLYKDTFEPKQETIYVGTTERSSS